MAQAFAAANRIRSMRPRKAAVSGASPFSLGDLGEHEKRPQGVKIELKNVWFKYPTRDVMVLNGLNMTVSLAIKWMLYMLTSF